MIIKAADLPTSSKMKTIIAGVTYRTSQSTMNAPFGKNIVGREIVNRPQICSPGLLISNSCESHKIQLYSTTLSTRRSRVLA
jgi:hypothetical protein